MTAPIDTNATPTTVADVQTSTATQQITVQRALASLTNYPDRITSAISRGVFVGIVKGAGRKPENGQFKTVDELSARIQSSTDSVEGLIAARSALKAAINQSNQVTMVNFQGKQISVADLIDLKKVVQFKATYLATLRRQVTLAQGDFNKLTTALEQQVATTIAQAAGGKDKTVDSSLADTLRKAAEDQLKPELVYAASKGISLAEYIEQLDNEIRDFTENVDATLSEINATTFITIAV